MSLSLHSDAALVLIDIQTGFEDPKWGSRNNPGAEDNARRLLLAWRLSGRPVFHVQHASLEPESPLRPSQPGFQINPKVEPESGEPVITKNVNSAFIGTTLEQQLRARGIQELVIAGLTTPHCISTSTRMAGNLGFVVYLVSDATAAFDLTGPDGTVVDAETVHRVSLTELHSKFATVVDTESLLRAAADRSDK